MENQVKEKTFDKLGFNQEEAGEIVGALNLLLANYAIVYQKIRNYHWNVVGDDFFEIHEKLEEEYTAASEAIDQIAERVRILGFRPLSTYAEFLEHADIEEPKGAVKSSDMMPDVVSDFQTLLSFMIDVADVATEFGDLGTETLMRSMVTDLEKKNWMYSAYLQG